MGIAILLCVVGYIDKEEHKAQSLTTETFIDQESVFELTGHIGNNNEEGANCRESMVVVF